MHLGVGIGWMIGRGGGNRRGSGRVGEGGIVFWVLRAKDNVFLVALCDCFGVRDAGLPAEIDLMLRISRLGHQPRLIRSASIGIGCDQGTNSIPTCCYIILSTQVLVAEFHHG